jgi:hypothetical protein
LDDIKEKLEIVKSIETPEEYDFKAEEVEEPKINFYTSINCHQVMNDMNQTSNSSIFTRFLQFLGLNVISSSQSEQGPFAIYAVEIHTPYSKRILKKSFSDFANL